MDTPANFSHAHNTLLPVVPGTSGQNNPLSTPPPAPYDEQLGLTFTQNFLSIAYNVTAVPQNDSYGYGPAYLLNGLSNDGYWYQVGLSYHWPYSSGGYNQGFNLNYNVFNSAGNVVSPSGGGGGLKAFSPVNSGDLVLLYLYFNNGIVYMYAKDWNTSAVSYVTYPDSHTTEFVGGLGSQFFTGLMTEWYHVSPYYGDESTVNYTDSGFALSSGWMWMDEWQPPNGPTQCPLNPTQVTYSSNPTQLQYFYSNGATEYSSAYQFTTGSMQEATTIALLPADASNPISSSDSFEVTYTLYGQNWTMSAQTGNWLLTDVGSNVTISGISSDSTSTEEWVLNMFSAPVTIPAGSNSIFYYYDLLNQPVAYWADSNSINPYLSYISAPFWSSSSVSTSSNTMLLPYYWQQIIWVLRGTAVSVNGTITGTAQDQWATPTSSWTITQADQIYDDIFYYHQYQVTANYTTSDNSVPSLTPLLIGTQLGSNYQLPLTTSNQTTWLDENTQWFVANVSAPSGTEQWVCSTGNSGTITQETSINPAYIHQYYLTVISIGSPTGSGWYNAGSTAYAGLASGTVPYGTGAQWVFDGWTTGGNNYQQSNAITMNSAATAIAVWNLQYYLTVTSAYGSPSGTGWYNAGTTANFGVTSPVSVASGEQYTFASWTGSGSGSYSGNTVSGACQMNAPVTESASWNTQYYLTVTSSYGSPTGEGWYNSGASATFGVTTPSSGGTGTQYLLSAWSGSGTGSYSGSAASYSVTMSNAITEAASWTTQYYLTVNNGGYGTATGSGWYNSGSSTQAIILSNIVSGEVGTQYVFSGWTGDASGSGSTSNTITMTSPKTATATWTTQYQLTFAVTPSGSASTTPTGTNLWIDSGPLSISAIPNSGYSFSQWTANSGSITFSNPSSMSTTADVNGPGTITASLASNPTPTPPPTSSGSSSSNSSSSSSTPTASPTPTPSPGSTSTIQATTSSGGTVDLTISGNVTAQQISNVTITSTQSTTTTIVSFTITGPTGTEGFGNITIPKSDVPYGTTPTIYIDGQPASNQGYTQDSNNYYVWYTTHFSTHQVSIVFTTTAPSPSPTAQSSLPQGAIYGIAVAVVIVVIVAVVLVLRKSKKGKS
jgi:uncharacterized repeat protein (TIGR02543 family)